MEKRNSQPVRYILGSLIVTFVFIRLLSYLYVNKSLKFEKLHEATFDLTAFFLIFVAVILFKYQYWKHLLNVVIIKSVKINEVEIQLEVIQRNLTNDMPELAKNGLYVYLEESCNQVNDQLRILYLSYVTLPKAIKIPTDGTNGLSSKKIISILAAHDNYVDTKTLQAFFYVDNLKNIIAVEPNLQTNEKVLMKSIALSRVILSNLKNIKIEP